VEIAVVPVGGDFGPEVRRDGEGFAIEELIFDHFRLTATNVAGAIAIRTLAFTAGPPLPVFQPVNLTQGTLDLTWSTEAGASYQLQSNSDLNSTNWTSLGGPQTATGSTLSATDYATNGPARFYRAVRLPAGH
jgi:hypothetical protein